MKNQEIDNDYSYMTKIMDLHDKPRSEKFTEEELGIIRDHLGKDRNKYVCKYAFYNKPSSKKLHIAFIIDTMHGSRRSGIENNWDYHVSRPISDLEFEEVVQNFGCNLRRFIVYYYRDVEHIIKEDQLYDVETPQKFIDECKRRGYSGNYQTAIEFKF